MFSEKDIESGEHYGLETSADDFILIDKSDPKYSSFKQASHCLIYSVSNSNFGIYESNATVLMQMRFDGYFGFPGGLVDENESPVRAVNREIYEEMNWKVDAGFDKGPVKEEHHIFTHFNDKSKLLCHFYAICVDYDQFLSIEQNSTGAKDFGQECLGVVRVPLYTMVDGYRGFPCFLHMQFVGNAKYQLLETLKKLNILSEEYITKSLRSTPVQLTSVFQA